MVQYAEVLRSVCGRKSALKPQAFRAWMNATRAIASGRWVVNRRLRKSNRWLRWVFQTSRSIWRMDSVCGRTCSVFRLPMMWSTICFESTTEMGSVTASVIRKP